MQDYELGKITSWRSSVPWKETSKAATLSFWQSWRTWSIWRDISSLYNFVKGNFMIFLVSKYFFLHKIDQFYVNLNDKTISVLVNNERLEAIKFWHFDIEKYYMMEALRMHDESLEKIRQIVKDKNKSKYEEE
jgi:hypothetical protein